MLTELSLYISEIPYNQYSTHTPHLEGGGTPKDKVEKHNSTLCINRSKSEWFHMCRRVQKIRKRNTQSHKAVFVLKKKLSV